LEVRIYRRGGTGPGNPLSPRAGSLSYLMTFWISAAASRRRSAGQAAL
jgi:hypothetical protein